jgi:hypothetical protein
VNLALWTLGLLATVFLVGMVALVIAGTYSHQQTEAIERVLLPTITGLIGVLGGMCAKEARG